MEKNKKQNINGPINFNGPTQFAQGDIINNLNDFNEKKAKYTPEPIWRSPFTMALLSWISFALAISSLLPLSEILKKFMNLLDKDQKSLSGNDFNIIFFLIILLLFIVFLSLRRITKHQTRYPLLFDFAISGYDNRLTLEKIHIDKCPQCGGKMKYYNKTIEWRDIRYANGKTKREVIKKIPVLECKRNSNHCYTVDPAEDKV